MSNDMPVPIDPAASDWLVKNEYGRPESWSPLGGAGDLHCLLIHTDSGRKLVLKLASENSSDRWQAEADGLQYIGASGAIRTPKVLFVDEDCLLLEYIVPAHQAGDYWNRLAVQLAQLHGVTQSQSMYGLDHHNYCGQNQQLNGWFDSGYTLFAENRLLHQARMAYDNGYLESPWIISIESICDRLEDLVPPQPPSLLHGDLWPGNILVDDGGEPVLIDPAVYYGWREADIAMTLLFGGLPHDFYTAYENSWPMEQGWRKRVPLYNLYHLLNHLNIFGTSYLEQVTATIARYA